MAKLIPIHIHTEYSLLDGMIRVGDLVKYAVENELPAIAITDHGVMYSAIEFYEKAKEAGINPLIGCEFYVHNGDITQKDSNNNPLWHLILVAKNAQGYKTLLSLYRRLGVKVFIISLVLILNSYSNITKVWFVLLRV